mmetsp:Transcript_62267/g.200755  ORF Transcript_62267/g.200755 Transcript_62267/m.200755 type:complete len:250 (-) Transcript_62267:498-1247(-)
MVRLARDRPPTLQDPHDACTDTCVEGLGVRSHGPRQLQDLLGHKVPTTPEGRHLEEHGEAVSIALRLARVPGLRPRQVPCGLPRAKAFELSGDHWRRHTEESELLQHLRCWMGVGVQLHQVGDKDLIDELPEIWYAGLAALRPRDGWRVWRRAARAPPVVEGRNVGHEEWPALREARLQGLHQELVELHRRVRVRVHSAGVRKDARQQPLQAALLAREGDQGVVQPHQPPQLEQRHDGGEERGGAPHRP